MCQHAFSCHDAKKTVMTGGVRTPPPSPLGTLLHCLPIGGPPVSTCVSLSRRKKTGLTPCLYVSLCVCVCTCAMCVCVCVCRVFMCASVCVEVQVCMSGVCVHLCECVYVLDMCVPLWMCMWGHECISVIVLFVCVRVWVGAFVCGDSVAKLVIHSVVCANFPS